MRAKTRFQARSASLGLLLVCGLASAPLRADFKQAVAFFSQAKYDKALEAIRPEVEANPDWEFGHRLQGLCYVQLGQNSLAVASLTRAVQLKSETFSTFQGLGQAYFNLGKYGDAATILDTGQRYAKTADDRYYLHHLRGSANLHLKRYTAATSDLANAIKIRPGQHLDYAQLGAAYLGMNSLPEALAALQKADELQPGNAATRENLGRVYELSGARSLKEKDYTTAVNLLIRARDLKPDSGTVQYNIGSAYIHLGRLQEAEFSLLRAATLLPAQAEVFELLGFVYEKNRALDKALDAYQKAASLRPSAENQASVERILKRKAQPPA